MQQKLSGRSTFKLFSFVSLVSLLFSTFRVDTVLPVHAQAASTVTPPPAATAIPEYDATVQDSDKATKPIAAQFIIHFKNGTPEKEKEAFVHARGGKVVQRIDALNILVIRLPKQAQGMPSPKSAIVESSEQDYYIDALDDMPPPNDPRYAEQWALPAIGAPSAWSQMPADAPYVTVAVVDSGICASHPDLEGRVIDGWDFIGSDAIPQDDFGHGCSVSGVIASNINNGIGIAGVAPNTRIMPLRVLNSSGVGSYSDVAAATVYAADHGVQVINLSLGGSSPSTALESAVNYAIAKNVIVVAAAGNNGTEGALYPAAYPDVIAVGSVDPDLKHSSFSNYGSQVDIWAPGRDILTTKRDGSYGLVSGTSFAAPYVAGAEVIAISSFQSLVVNGEILSFAPTLITTTQTTEQAPLVSPTASVTENPPQIETPIGKMPINSCNNAFLEKRSLDGVDLNVCMPFTPDHNSIANSEDWVQAGSWIKVSPHEEFSIYAIPYGVRPSADNLKTAMAGITDEYKQASLNFYKPDAIAVIDGPSISIFDTNVTGTTYLVFDKNFTSQNGQQLITEWIAEAGNRVWIVRSISYGQFSDQTFRNSILESRKIISIDSQTLDNSSTSLEQHQNSQSSASQSNNTQSLSNLPTPSWWDGNCDTNRYLRITGTSSYQLSAPSFRGLVACGPGSVGTSYPYGLLTSFGAGVAQYEFQCAELPKRYLYLLYGIAPKSADGINVVNVYDNALPNLRKVSNGTPNSGISAGDIISYNGPTSAGHTAIITSVNVDANGNGTYTTIEQNSSATGTRTNTISNWWLNSNSGISVYLHDSGTGGGGSTCKATTTNLPSGYTKCAEEGSGNYCTFSGTLTVYYGANSCFDIEPKTNGVECTNASFGGDPLDGVHKACYINSSSSSGNWSVRYFNGHDHWWDTNNFNNQMCQGTISGSTLDKSYGSSAPCGNSVSDNWVAEYNATINFSPGRYVFQVQNDDGLKLWVNGTSILERGGSQGLSYVCPARDLGANTTIRAILNEEGGDASVKIGWTTDTSVCNPPGSFAKNNPSNGGTGQPTSPTIGWNSSNGANSYSYCIDSSNNNNCDTGWQSVGNVTSKVLSGLTAGTTYYWHVRAHSDGGVTYSNGDAWWSFTIGVPAPGAFNKNGPSNNSTNQSTSPSLAWGASSGATSYQYCIDTTNDNTCNTSWASNGTNTSITLSNLSSNTTYYWHVRASNAGSTTYSNGGSNAFWSFTTAATAPSAPSLSSPGNGSSNPYNYDLTFQWNSASGATEYQIEWWGGPYSTMQPCGWSTSTSCHIGTVYAGYTYSWHVRARNSYGTSGWSPTWTFTIQPAPLPDLVPFPRNSASDPVVVSRSQNWPYTETLLSGQTAYYYWGYKNIGQSNAGAHHVKVYVDNQQFIDYPFSGLGAGSLGGFDNWSESLYVAPGPHQVKIIVDANGEVNESNESNNTWTGTVYWRNPKIDLYEVFTTDDLGPTNNSNILRSEDVKPSAYKDTFNPGDPIRLYLAFTNEFLNDRTFTGEWQVINPAGRVVPELSSTETTTLGSGSWWWWQNTTVPASSLRGEYTFVGKITYNGVTTTQTTTFTVIGLPAVEVYDVFVTDENGNATSLEITPHVSVPLDVRSESVPTFSAGDGIQLYIDTYNDVADGETATFQWEVIDPWGRWVEELSWSGDLNPALGESWWYLPTTIPAHAVTGDYIFTGYITHNGRTTQQSQTFHVTGGAAPSNNGFSTPAVIGSVPYIDIRDTWGATVAVSDPIPTCGSGKNSNSVWYRYTPPANGLLEIDTWGSDYDTVVAVWTGTSGNLTQVACNDDSYGDLQAWLEGVPVIAAITYHIEVMDYGAPGGGNLELYVNFAPSVANDDFGAPVTISTNPFNTTLNTGGATKASDDPSLTACNRLPGEASVWYRYTPTRNGELELDTKGSDYDTMLAVWTGTRGNLNSIGCNDDVGDVNGEWDSDSILTVPLTANTIYYIEVSTYAGKIDVNEASANELENKPMTDVEAGSITGLQELKNAVENEGAPVMGSTGTRPGEIGAQFWGGQLQLHATFRAAPGTFNRVAPSNLATFQNLNPVISWGASIGAASYEYCYDTTNDNNCGPWVNASTATSANLNGLEPYTTYYWHVRASNVIGTTYANGSASNYWSFTTGGVSGAFSKSSPANGVANRPLSLALTWAASSNAASYQYCYDTTDDNTCSNWTSNGTSTSKTLSGLTPYTTYYWHVRAVNSFGATYSNESETTIWSFTTGGVPGTFNKSNPAHGSTNQPLSITLTWDASSNATSYQFCYDTTNDSACSTWTSNGASTSKTLSGLSQNTTYYWHVRAVNSFGTTYSNGSQTTFWSFRTSAIPGAFSKSSPGTGVTNRPLSVTLTWSGSSNAASYQYCYDTTNDNACSNWTDNGTATSKALSGLSQYTTYYWHVRAVNSFGTTYSNSSPTAFWFFRTGGAPAAFNKSLPSNGAINQPLSVTLKWGASTNATSYQYCYDTTNDGICLTWTSNGTATSKTISGLSQNTTYYWHVRAVNSFGATYSNGSPTAFRSFRTGSAPAAFNKTSPVSGAVNQPLSVKLAWAASSGATSYQYCYDKTNDNACSTWVSNGTATSKVITGLSQNTTYYWHVRAVNAFGSTYSNGVGTAFSSFRTGGVPGSFNKVSPASGTKNQLTSVTLTWAPSSGATSYQYCYDKSNDNACSTWVSNGTATSKTLSGLSQNTTYYWHVRAVNSFGTTYSNASTSKFWSFKTRSAVVKTTLNVANDGWVLESGEITGVGGTMNGTATTLNVGDDAANKQYRAILSFNTAGLPDNAVITSVTFRIMQQGILGTNPFSTHGDLVMDVYKGAFSGNGALQLTDFQATASADEIATIPNTPSAGWYSSILNAAAYSYINKIGVTQFRLRFTLDDNDDLDTDYIAFYSSRATTVNRPQLIVKYYVP